MVCVDGVGGVGSVSDGDIGDGCGSGIVDAVGIGDVVVSCGDVVVDVGVGIVGMYDVDGGGIVVVVVGVGRVGCDDGISNAGGVGVVVCIVVW